MITASKDVTSAVCKIHEEFENGCARSDSVYILPVQGENDVKEE